MLTLLAMAVPLFATELPVRHVVLYKNGVGYFERSGEVKPGEPAQLSFKESEMNDVLKSLTVRDASGAAVRGVRYESAEPLDQKLAAFPFDPGKASLSTFLSGLQGARLSIMVGADRVTGAILLARMAQPGDREQVVIVLDGGEIRSVDLGAATSIQFADPSLQNRLRDYLRVLAGSRSADKRVVTIDAPVRSLTASYMIPAPIWKSSYRLILDTPDTTLEGWAIVDNTTGEDWSNVKLALVSGRPVSFLSNLFQTRTVERQVADLPDSGAVNPVVHAAGVVGGVPGGVVGGIIGAAPAAAPPPPPPPAYARTKSSTVAITTQAREFGDLFEYSFEQPVSVQSGQSAMLPFLQQKLTTRKLLIYSDHSSAHPMSAVEVTNSTGKTLDGGPLTVFESASYAGEALMATLKQGDKRLVSYAVDLGTRITTALDNGSHDIREVHVKNGMLTTRRAEETVTTYTIRNVDARAKTLWLEHPIRGQNKLVGMKPIETTASAYRFEVKLAPNSEQRFAVNEEDEYDTSFTVSDAMPGVLLTYVQGRGISEAGKKSLQQIMVLQQKVQTARQEGSRIESQIQNTSRDQERTRQNIQSLNQVSTQQELVQKYARQLADQEARLAALRDEQEAAAKRRAALEVEWKTLIESTEF